MLTKKQIKDYLDKEGNFCPYCGSGNIGAVEEVDAFNPVVTHHIACNDCGREWYDLLTLTGIDEIEDNDDDPPTQEKLFELTHNMTDIIEDVMQHPRDCNCHHCSGEPTIAELEGFAFDDDPFWDEDEMGGF